MVIWAEINTRGSFAVLKEDSFNISVPQLFWERYNKCFSSSPHPP